MFGQGGVRQPAGESFQRRAKEKRTMRACGSKLVNNAALAERDSWAKYGEAAVRVREEWIVLR